MSNRVSVDFAERVRMNQQRLSSDLKAQYDFIVCGSGSSGSVVARRLAGNPDVSLKRAVRRHTAGRGSRPMADVPW
jgi:ribulose 1,5-bisphosphate synthetase/thiazole synthase